MTPERLEAFLGGAPYIRFLGMQVAFEGDVMTGLLPFAPHLVGNPMLPALHGGVIGAFMEATALIQLSAARSLVRAPKTIDVNIDYLRPGRAETTYAQATLRKVGRRVANVQVEAWQSDRMKPVAGLTGHFRLPG